MMKMKQGKRNLKRMFVLLMVMAMMSGLCGCGAKKVIHIASKPMTEQYILTEIIAQLIETETDYETEITKGVGGGTTNIHPALVKGEFDLYPEYTRTAWLNVLKKEEMEKDDEKLYAQLQEEYDALGLTWTGLTAFPIRMAWRSDRRRRISTAWLPTLIWRRLPESLPSAVIRTISSWRPAIPDSARLIRCSFRM